MSKSVDRDDFLSRILRSDDPQAISVLYKQYFRMVVTIAYDIVKEKETAKDIAQELFMTIWEKRHQIDLGKSMKAYLVRSAINQSLYHLRKNAKKHQITLEVLDDTKFSLKSEGYLLDNEIEFKELKVKIHQIIETLSPTCKKVYKLSRTCGLTNAQIANRLGISVKAVEKHVSKALKTLRSTLKPYLKALMVLILG